MGKTTLMILALLPALTTLTAAAATPADNYARLCTMCHLPGAHGAPQVGDRDDWTQRLRPGLNTVYRNAIEGIPNTAMMAKGGHTELSDTEIRAIVDYMIAASAVPAGVLRDAARYDKLGLTDPDFIRLDTSRDGFLSRSELAGDAALIRNFARFDSNKDGRLSETEYRNAETRLEQERAAMTVDDAELAAAVRKALAGVKGIDSEYLKIEVTAGALVMTGIVGHASVAIQAQDTVKRVPGVKSIRNRLVSGDQIGWD
jgi:cytochrome c5